MKFVSWNVNGLRACIEKGFMEQFNTLQADFFCLQEIKLSEGQLTLELPGYEQFWCYAEKKGYSGTAIFTKHKPLSVRYGLGVEALDHEGRMITLEYPEFFLVTCYTPNAQRELARLDHRMKWDEAFRDYLSQLDAQKPVILCGDLNVAHQEIDLKNPKSNRGSAGFSDQERESFTKTLALGFSDTFRQLHPDATGAYSWWSYMFKAREKNVGWRIDYFLVSDRIKETVYRARIHSDIYGSDHCPVSIETDLPCNGGIWTPLAEEAPVPELPKKLAPKTAILGAAGTVLALFLCLLLFLPQAQLPQPSVPPTGDTSPSGPDPNLYNSFLTVAEFTQPLQPVLNASTSYYNYYTPTCNYYTNTKLQQGYFFAPQTFRIELSEDAPADIDPSDTLTVVPSNVFSNWTSSTLYSCRTVPYYSDPEKTVFSGWLVFADFPTLTSVDILLVDDGDTLASLTYTPTAPDYSKEFQVQQCSVTSQILLPDLPTDRMAVQLETDAGSFYSYEIFYDLPPYYTAYIQAPAQVLASATYQDLLLEAVYSDPVTGPLYWNGLTYSAPLLEPVYMDPEMTKPCGWILYSPLPSTQVTLNLHWNNERYTHLETFHIPFEPEFQLTYSNIPPEWTTYQVYPDWYGIPTDSTASAGICNYMYVDGYQLYAAPWELSSQDFTGCVYVQLSSVNLSIHSYNDLALSAWVDSDFLGLEDSMTAVRPVYSDATLLTPCGWLVYTRNPQSREIQLQLSWNDRDGAQAWQQAISAQGPIRQLLNYTVYESLERLNYDPVTGEPLQSRYCIPMNINGGRVFMNHSAGTGLSYATYTLFIALPEVEGSSYSLSLLNSADLSSCKLLDYFAVYADASLNQQLGWVVYSFHDQVTDWCVQLSWKDSTATRRRHVALMPDLTPELPTEKVEDTPVDVPLLSAPFEYRFASGYTMEKYGDGSDDLAPATLQIHGVDAPLWYTWYQPEYSELDYTYYVYLFYSAEAMELLNSHSYIISPAYDNSSLDMSGYRSIPLYSDPEQTYRVGELMCTTETDFNAFLVTLTWFENGLQYDQTEKIPLPTVVTEHYGSFSFQLTGDLTEFDHDPFVSTWVPYQDQVMLLFGGNALYARPWEGGAPQYEYAVYLEAPSRLLQEVPYSQLICTQGESRGKSTLRAVFSDRECTSPCGWIAYIHSYDVDTLDLWLTWRRDGDDVVYRSSLDLR